MSQKKIKTIILQIFSTPQIFFRPGVDDEWWGLQSGKLQPPQQLRLDEDAGLLHLRVLQPGAEVLLLLRPQEDLVLDVLLHVGQQQQCDQHRAPLRDGQCLGTF